MTVIYSNCTCDNSKHDHFCQFSLNIFLCEILNKFFFRVLFPSYDVLHTLCHLFFVNNYNSKSIVLPGTIRDIPFIMHVALHRTISWKEMLVSFSKLVNL